MSRVTESWYVADRRWYLTADGRAVAKGDPAALRLLLPVGGRLPWAQARAYGLTAEEHADPASSGKAVAAPPKTKALAAPAHDKAAE